METSSRFMVQANRFNTAVNTLTQASVLIYQALAVVVFVVSLFSAYAWLKNPFLGGFFEQTMVINESVKPANNGRCRKKASGLATSWSLLPDIRFPMPMTCARRSNRFVWGIRFML
jgi:hypothetical protein